MSDKTTRLLDDLRIWGDGDPLVMRAVAEIERLRAIVRVNGLRWGHSHAEIDAILDGKRNNDAQS